MNPLLLAILAALIALLPEYSDAMASKHHHRGGDGKEYHEVASNAGPDASGPDHSAPIALPEPGSLVLLATGLSTLGGLLAGRWYVTKKRAKRPERPEL